MQRSTIYYRSNLFDQVGMASLFPATPPPTVHAQNKLDQRTLPLRFARIVSDYNFQKRLAHKKRDDGCHSPAAVLGWVRGMQSEPDLVYRAFSALCETRTLTKGKGICQGPKFPAVWRAGVGMRKDAHQHLPGYTDAGEW
jgi:hypothetical protein